MPALTTVPPQATNVISIAVGNQACFALRGDGKPHITVQPFNRKVRQNAPATLWVKAVGHGVLSYQWQCNGLDLPGATNGFLTLASTQFGPGKTYRCRVANSLGSVVSQDAVLLDHSLRFSATGGGPRLDAGELVFNLMGASGAAPLVLYTARTWKPGILCRPMPLPLGHWKCARPWIPTNKDFSVWLKSPKSNGCDST